MESAMATHQEGFESTRGRSKFVLTLQLSLNINQSEDWIYMSLHKLWTQILSLVLRL